MYDKERGLYIAHCANGALSITGKMANRHCANGALSITGKMANRHGLIAGATGTGKTVTLQVMPQVQEKLSPCKSWQRLSARQAFPASWPT